MTHRERIHTAIALGVAILWQVYAVFLAYRHAGVLGGLLEGSAEPLPRLTQWFFSTHRLWPLVPIAFLLLTIHLLYMQSVRLVHSGALLAAAFVVALLLHSWTQEAFFQPLFTMMRALG